jgi:hypothetical protein
VDIALTKVLHFLALYASIRIPHHLRQSRYVRGDYPGIRICSLDCQQQMTKRQHAAQRLPTLASLCSMS